MGGNEAPALIGVGQRVGGKAAGKVGFEPQDLVDERALGEQHAHDPLKFLAWAGPQHAHASRGEAGGPFQAERPLAGAGGNRDGARGGREELARQRREGPSALYRARRLPQHPALSDAHLTSALADDRVIGIEHQQLLAHGPRPADLKLALVLFEQAQHAVPEGQRDLEVPGGELLQGPLVEVAWDARLPGGDPLSVAVALVAEAAPRLLMTIVKPQDGTPDAGAGSVQLLAGAPARELLEPSDELTHRIRVRRLELLHLRRCLRTAQPDAEGRRQQDGTRQAHGTASGNYLESRRKTNWRMPPLR